MLGDIAPKLLSLLHTPRGFTNLTMILQKTYPNTIGKTATEIDSREPEFA